MKFIQLLLGDDQVNGWFILNKQSVLNEYVNVIRNMTQAYHGLYVDMRYHYLKNIPMFSVAYPGFSISKLLTKTNYYVTYDGEHPNVVSNNIYFHYSVEESNHVIIFRGEQLSMHNNGVISFIIGFTLLVNVCKIYLKLFCTSFTCFFYLFMNWT